MARRNKMSVGALQGQYSLSPKESRQLRKGLLGTAQDPVGAGQALAKFGGFYEGGLGRLQQFQQGDGSMGYTTPEMQGLLSSYKDIASRYSTGGRSSDTQDYLNRMKSMMAGYSAPEYQAMREQAQRGIDTQYQTGLAQQRVSQARGGVRGASATAQQQNLDRLRLGQQQQLEQDLFVRGADEMRRATEAYGGALRGAEADEYGRMTDTRNAYATALAGQEGRNREAAQYDLDRLMAERSGAVSSVLTASDLATQQRQFRERMRLAQEGLRRNRNVSV